MADEAAPGAEEATGERVQGGSPTMKAEPVAAPAASGSPSAAEPQATQTHAFCPAFYHGSAPQSQPTAYTERLAAVAMMPGPGASIYLPPAAADPATSRGCCGDAGGAGCMSAHALQLASHPQYALPARSLSPHDGQHFQPHDATAAAARYSQIPLPPHGQGLSGLNALVHAGVAETERRGHGGHAPRASVTFEQVMRLSHLPIDDAARELGVCTTVVKRVCRWNGVDRWPFRKIQGLTRSINTLTPTIENGTATRQQKQAYNRLIRKRERLARGDDRQAESEEDEPARMNGGSRDGGALLRHGHGAQLPHQRGGACAQLGAGGAPAYAMQPTWSHMPCDGSGQPGGLHHYAPVLSGGGLMGGGAMLGMQVPMQFVQAMPMALPGQMAPQPMYWAADFAPPPGSSSAQVGGTQMGPQLIGAPILGGHMGLGGQVVHHMPMQPGLMHAGQLVALGPPQPHPGSVVYPPPDGAMGGACCYSCPNGSHAALSSAPFSAGPAQTSAP